MRVAVSGSTGLVGSALCAHLEERGDRVIRLVRSSGSSASGTIPWNPAAGELEPSSLEGCDAVVHLSGENLSHGRWTRERRKRILTSRVASTQLLATALASLRHPPQVFVCASAIGFYGDRGEELLTEESAAGREGFLPEVCRAWEEAAGPAVGAGIRVVNLRIGVVLSPLGGALPKMARPFRFGLGGRLGSGRQFVSWITLVDLVGCFSRVLEDAALSGPVNAVAPHPVTNGEFTAALARHYGKPARLPAPAFLLNLALGQMAPELLLASTRVVPARLLAAGHAFRHPELARALGELLP